MAAGLDPKHPASQLLARWRATALPADAEEGVADDDRPEPPSDPGDPSATPGDEWSASPRDDDEPVLTHAEWTEPPCCAESPAALPVAALPDDWSDGPCSDRPARPRGQWPTLPPLADLMALLRAFEEAVAAALPSSQARMVSALIEPVRRAIGVAPAERDLAELVVCFDQAEDVLEALLLFAQPPPMRAG